MAIAAAPSSPRLGGGASAAADHENTAAGTSRALERSLKAGRSSPRALKSRDYESCRQNTTVRAKGGVADSLG